MRIGIFTDAYYPYISGVVTSVRTLENELRLLGHTVYIFTTANESIKELNNEYIVQFDGITVPTEKLKSFKLSFLLRKKVKEIKKYNLDIIHLHTEFSMARLACLASKKYHIPMVYTLHTLYEDYLQYISKTIDKYFHRHFLSILATILLKKVNKLSSIKIVPTKKTLANVNKYLLDGEFRVIPTGLDLLELLNKKVDNEVIVKLKDKLGLPKDKMILLSLGRVSEEKSIDVLIKALAKIKDSNLFLLVVGDGPNLEDLKELSKSLGLTNDNILFTGFISWDNIVPYYQVADLFLNASKTETQGLTYLESLTLGTPILVQYDECIEDILEEGINGFCFYDEEELVSKLKYFSKNRDIIFNLKDKTFDTIKEYSNENYALNALTCYMDAINKYNTKHSK